jgi:hypothetical protein
MDKLPNVLSKSVFKIASKCNKLVSLLQIRAPQRPNAHEVGRYRAVTGKKEETTVI